VKGHINFAILGCGKIAHKHAEVITRQLDDAQVVAACDLNVARAEEFASRYGVPALRVTSTWRGPRSLRHGTAYPPFRASTK